MDYQVDTNIMLRWAQPNDPQHQLAVDAIHKLHSQGDRPVLAPQIMVEFWNVATRLQNVNGFGLSPAQADALVQRIENLFVMLPETEAVYAEWRRLVTFFGVSGKQVHDTRIVAVMLTNSVTHILTLNVADFQRFTGITAVHPSSL